jgi:uroporphyrinogen III methyltransferase/synthase
MKVLITRAKSQAGEFAEYLAEFGFVPVFFPTIEITEPDSWDEVDAKIKKFDDYTDLIFTSANGVKFFFDRFLKFFPIEVLKAKNFHAVGVKTKKEIEKYGLTVNELPEKSDKEGLIEKILIDKNSGRKFLFPRGNLADESFIKILRDFGFEIDDVVVYKTIKPDVSDEMKEEVKKMIENGEIKVITFFSPSSVRNFFEIFGNVKFNGQKIAVIGDTTLKECEKFGLVVDINPMKYNPKPDAKFLAELIIASFRG